MAQTRMHILATALQLFNQQGLAHTSTHDLAKAAGIRQGNLTYHFARREQIVEALYEEFIAGVEGVFSEVMQPPLTLAKLYQAQLKQGEWQQRYRFLFLDFASIRQSHPRIDQHFQQLMRERRKGFGWLLQALQVQGTLRPDLPEEGEDLLFEQLVILGNFWPHAAAVFRPEDGQAHQHYARVALGLLWPYLTEQGQQEWAALSLT